MNSVLLNIAVVLSPGMGTIREGLVKSKKVIIIECHSMAMIT